MKTKVDLKTKALAEYLGIKTNEVIEEMGNYSADGAEYSVYTDDEADASAKESILESAWAFNKNFLNAHSKAIAEIDEKTYSKLQEGCESINQAVLAMIDDKEHFIEDAIGCDGRGHFISHYDGEENEQNGFYIYRTN